MSFLFSCVILILLQSYACTRNSDPLSDVKKTIHSTDDVMVWAKANLHYQNDDPWDEAPDLDVVVKNGYGDCKMLAGVVAELLSYLKVPNWIVTIKEDGQYHVFNVYMNSNNKFKIIDNAREALSSFTDWNGVLDYFGVKDLVNWHSKYSTFRSWFNHEIFPNP